MLAKDINEGSLKLSGTIKVERSVLPLFTERLVGTKQCVQIDGEDLTIIHKGDQTYKYDYQADNEVKDPEESNLSGGDDWGVNVITNHNQLSTITEQEEERELSQKDLGDKDVTSQGTKTQDMGSRDYTSSPCSYTLEGIGLEVRAAHRVLRPKGGLSSGDSDCETL